MGQWKRIIDHRPKCIAIIFDALKIIAMHFGRWGLPQEIISSSKQFHFCFSCGNSYYAIPKCVAKNLNVISSIRKKPVWRYLLTKINCLCLWWKFHIINWAVNKILTFDFLWCQRLWRNTQFFKFHKVHLIIYMTTKYLKQVLDWKNIKTNPCFFFQAIRDTNTFSWPPAVTNLRPFGSPSWWQLYSFWTKEIQV